MPKYPYKKLVVGQPYVKEPRLTQGFTPGVGYLKNFANHSPAMFISGVLTVIGVSLLGIVYINEKNTDPDMKNMYKKRYTVMRSEDVKEPTKACYN